MRIILVNASSDEKNLIGGKPIRFKLVQDYGRDAHAGPKRETRQAEVQARQISRKE